MDYQPFLKEVLSKASRIATSYFGKVTATTKAEDNNQVLTQADVDIGNLIVSKIKEAYPQNNIIDEEAGVIDRKSQYTWVVDPIDGTSNFAVGLPTYCIMVGLLDGAVPIVGGIALPYFEDICLAEKGKGAYSNEQKLQVTRETILLNSLVSYGIDGHQENPDLTRAECRMLAEIILNCRNLRTNNCNFDAVLVAKGQYGAWLNRTTKIWDNVAPQILIEEAGGLYTDFFGTPIDYHSPLTKAIDNFTACAAAPVLHKKLQEIIHQKTREKI